MAANAQATVTLSLIDRVTGPIKRIAARLGNLGKRMGLDRVSASIGNLGNRFKGLGQGIAATSGRLATMFGLLGASGAGAVTAAYGLAKSAADVGAEVFDMAGKLGIGAEQLQEYRFAAKMSGVEVATFDKGVEKLGLNAVAASKGNKELSKAFKNLGVRVKGSNGQMRSTEDILDDTMGALASIKDPLKRNAMAFKLFGKSGVELTKIMADGASGIRELREEARRTGNVFSKEATEASDELGDNVDALTERFHGLKNFIGIQLVPVVNEAVKAFTGWYDVNAKLIRSTISEWAGKMRTFIKDLIDPTSQVRIQFDAFAASVTSAYASVKPFVDFVGGPMKAALALIGLWALAPAITAVSLLALAFGRLGGSIAGVGIKGIRAVYDSVGGLFDGAAAELDASGMKSGSKWGKAFGIAARAAMIAGVALATAELLQTYDPKGNLGGVTKPLDDWMRQKLGLPEKDTGITPGEIWKGLFGSEDKKPASEKKASLAPAQDKLSPVALNLGFDKSPIFGGAAAATEAVRPRRYNTASTDAAPGKAKDDIVIPDSVIVHEPKTVTVTAPANVTVSITGVPLDQANTIAGAVKSALAQSQSEQRAAISSSLSD